MSWSVTRRDLSTQEDLDLFYGLRCKHEPFWHQYFTAGHLAYRNDCRLMARLTALSGLPPATKLVLLELGDLA